MRTSVTRNFRIVDSGALPGDENMRIDREALEAALVAEDPQSTLRFFNWSEPTVTYGYLLDTNAVKTWALDYPLAPLVQRPTGGGAVYHSTSDISLSILWPRASKLFSDHPRECYAEIHAILKNAIESSLDHNFTLKQPADSNTSCASPSTRRFSACFQEPVCNDVMLGDKKIAGGALRVTRRAMLYQGTIQLSEGAPMTEIKRALADAFNK